MRLPRLSASRSKFVGDALNTVWRTARELLRRKPRPKPPKILKPYIDSTTLRRKVSRFLFPIGLAFFCLVYGFFFGLTAPYLIVPFAAPCAILILLSIWALPDRPHAPVRIVEFLFSCVLVSLVLWPNYLALSLPGLPWITVNRLVSFPMAFLLMICVSTSQDFRTELGRGLTAVPGSWMLLVGFIVIQFVTIPFAKTISVAVQKSFLQQINWTFMYIIACWVFQKPGRAERYMGLFICLSIPIILITTLESRNQSLLWSGHVPAFLKIDDPTAIIAMSNNTRGATGLYRAKATFTGPLGLGEFLALMTPFSLYVATRPYKLIYRVVCAGLLPATFACFIMADSRLGIVGYGTSMLLYGLLWGLMTMMRERNSLIAAAVVYAYPAVFGVTAFAVLFVHRFHVMVFGGGAQAASNDARGNQLHMAIPKFLANPIGHGSGEGGDAMGYAVGTFISIDNYYITIALQWGIVGLITFIGMHLLTITYGIKATLRPAALKSRELSVLIPLCISLSAFLVIKGVFSQEDGHPLTFAMLGAVAGLIVRVNRAMAEEEAQREVIAPPPAKASQTRLPTPAPRFAKGLSAK
jgi:hypothetical protein